MPRRRLPKRWQEKLLAAVAQGKTVSAAAKYAGVSREFVYKALKRSSKFASQFEDAYEQGTDVLEDRAFQRAMEGSDAMLTFLLKARRPHVYRDNVRVEHDLGKELLDALNRAAQKSAEALAQRYAAQQARGGTDGDSTP